MALGESDVELIRASWIPARKDPIGAGVLLFKGLFTKFPDYLRFFNQFTDLDLDRLQDNKRLIKHAVRVIDTVTFVVDSVGDQTKSELLNEALVNLVRGHLKRRIGLAEFRNLGVVLIDFICDLNNRRAIEQRPQTGAGIGAQATDLRFNSTRLTSGGASSSASSSQDSETMTSALDKIRASSSPSSSSEDENLIAKTGGASLVEPSETGPSQNHKHSAYQHNEPADHQAADDTDTNTEKRAKTIQLDANLLVGAWTKLYGTILDLVKSEEEQACQ